MTDQDRKYVYVVGPGNKAVRKDVTLGDFADELRIVRSGLDANDKVIVAGLQKIFVPNTPVKPKIVAMGALPPAAVLASAQNRKHAHGFLQILHRPPDLPRRCCRSSFSSPA